jgi:hypothetical protein
LLRDNYQENGYRFAHRASTAFFAASRRCSLVSAFARALPPMAAISLTVSGFFCLDAIFPY